MSKGSAYGGNKTRKLECIAPEILTEGADAIVSIGGFQSSVLDAHLGGQPALNA